jgi:hypothetical protein
LACHYCEAALVAGLPSPILDFPPNRVIEAADSARIPSAKRQTLKLCHLTDEIAAYSVTQTAAARKALLRTAGSSSRVPRKKPSFFGFQMHFAVLLSDIDAVGRLVSHERASLMNRIASSTCDVT